MLRDIVEENSFSEQLAALEDNAKRADELIQGVGWILARNPRMGWQVSPESKVWMIFSNSDFADIDDLTIYYTFNAEHVYLLAIEKADREE